MYLVVEGRGAPISVVLTGANRHDNVSAVGDPRPPLGCSRRPRSRTMCAARRTCLLLFREEPERQPTRLPMGTSRSDKNG